MVQKQPFRSSAVATGTSSSSSSSSSWNINHGTGRLAPHNSPSSSLENGFQFLRLNSSNHQHHHHHHFSNGQNGPTATAQFPFHHHHGHPPSNQLVAPAPRKIKTKKLTPLDTNLISLNPASLNGSRKTLSRGPVTPTGTEASTAFSSLLQPIFKSAATGVGGSAYASCPSPSSPRLYFNRNGMAGGCPSPLPFAMDEDLTENGVSAEECLQSPPVSSLNIDRPIHHVV